MRIRRNPVIPAWYTAGTTLSADEITEVTDAAQWYMLLGQIHGHSTIIDERPLNEKPQWQWRKCAVPVNNIFPQVFAYQDPARLNSIRKGPAETVPPIIVELAENHIARLLDGSHRITVHRETGQPTIVAYVGVPIF